MDAFTRWWMLLSKVVFMDKQEVACRAWDAATEHEREACAKVCESQTETGAHIRCAAAIRARSNA